MMIARRRIIKIPHDNTDDTFQHARAISQVLTFILGFVCVSSSRYASIARRLAEKVTESIGDASYHGTIFSISRVRENFDAAAAAR